MYLSFFDLFDLFIRLISVGQLFLLCIYIASKDLKLNSLLAISVSICLISYILLSAPISNEHYGVLRGVLLFFTEVAPYLLWLLVFSLFKDDFQPQRWPEWLKITLGFTLIWFSYFFGYMEGKGAFHQINHLFELFVILHIIFVVLKEFPDDLVAARRNARVVTIVFTCIYAILILLLELGDSSLRDSPVFSLLNAGLVCLSTSIFSWYFFQDKFKDRRITVAEKSHCEHSETDTNLPKIPNVYKNIHLQLRQLMLDGFYKETQLSIKTLASKLQTPEHQLRELINKHLGYRNFSDFLSSYRIPAACAQFEDLTHVRKPILTIALELGYGSIAPFNRTFKAQKGMTPKEYRSKFQK